MTELKDKSLKTATEALPFQGDGKVAEAQKRMVGAHNRMGEAMHYQGQAEGFQKTAGTLQGDMGLYDLAAGAAKAYAAYKADPGVGNYDIPDLPKGLRFEK